MDTSLIAKLLAEAKSGTEPDLAKFDKAELCSLVRELLADNEAKSAEITLLETRIDAMSEALGRYQYEAIRRSEPPNLGGHYFRE